MSEPQVGKLFFKLCQRCLQNKSNSNLEVPNEFFDKKSLKTKLNHEVKKIFYSFSNLKELCRFIDVYYCEFDDWCQLLTYKQNQFLNHQRSQLHPFHHIFDDDIISFSPFMEICRIAKPTRENWEKTPQSFVAFFLFFFFVQFVSFYLISKFFFFFSSFFFFFFFL